MFRVGLAQWHHKDWAAYLGGYGLEPYVNQFSTVEAGSTFYALPSMMQVAHWLNTTPSTFRFSFKLPSTITHQLGLVNCGRELKAFFDVLDPLLDRCAPFLIQLPPKFSADYFRALERFLLQLPSDIRFGVEFRHADFFDRVCWERRANQLLYRLGIERVWFDTRLLFSAKADTEATRDARAKKPNYPVYGYCLTDTPMVRLMSHTHWETAGSVATQWADRFSQWLNDGKQVYCFTHTPSNAKAPLFAEAMHNSVAARTRTDQWCWRAGSQVQLL